MALGGGCSEVLSGADETAAAGALHAQVSSLEIRLSKVTAEEAAYRSEHSKLGVEVDVATARWLQAQQESFEIAGRLRAVLQERDEESFAALRCSQQCHKLESLADERCGSLENQMQAVLESKQLTYDIARWRHSEESLAALKAAQAEQREQRRHFDEEVRTQLECASRHHEEQKTQICEEFQKQLDASEMRLKATLALESEVAASYAEALAASALWKQQETQVAHMALEMGNDLAASRRQAAQEAAQCGRASAEAALFRDACQQMREEVVMTLERFREVEVELPRLRNELTEREAALRDIRQHEAAVVALAAEKGGSALSPWMPPLGLGGSGEFSSPLCDDASIFTGDEGFASLPASLAGLSMMEGGSCGFDNLAPIGEHPHEVCDEVQALQNQLQKCKTWISKMRISGEEANTELKRLRSKEVELNHIRIDCEMLRTRIANLQADNSRVSAEKKRLMDVNNAMRAQLVNSSRQGEGHGLLLGISVAKPLVHPARLEEEENKREECAKKLLECESMVQRLTAQNRALRAELEGDPTPKSRPAQGGAGDAAAGSSNAGLVVEGHSPAGYGRVPRLARDRSTGSQRTVQARLQELHQRGQELKEERRAEVQQRWSWMGVGRLRTSSERLAAGGADCGGAKP